MAKQKQAQPNSAIEQAKKQASEIRQTLSGGSQKGEQQKGKGGQQSQSQGQSQKAADAQNEQKKQNKQ